jgi:hypothetical protein
MWLEIGIAVGIPAVGAGVAAARYFWKKSQCFITLQNKVEEMSDHDVRLDQIEKRQGKNEIYLKLLLRHNNIEFDE